ncbi:MAG: aspartyl protease family protein [candidate division Zixibacteria bacterium]|nr:aspartyl protease family protein [candidate division Zixibacteria bacterium]
MRNKVITLKRIISGSLVILTLITAKSFAQGNLSDPYGIFGKYFESIGGLEKIKAESTFYSEAELAVYGLKGNIRLWTKSPIYERQEVDLQVFKETAGDNGNYKWTADINNKVKIDKDENVLKRREIRMLMARYDFLNRNSSTFSLSYEGIEKIGGNECYVIKTINNINEDYILTFIDRSSFLIVKEISHTPDEESHTLYSDYREVNGMLKPFHQEIKTLPEGQESVIQVIKYESNIEIDPLLFEPPAEDFRDFRFTKGNSSENIPFVYFMNHIFLGVNIRGKERLWVFDTGSGASVIDSAFAVELGLEAMGDIKGQGAGHVISLSVVKLPSFSVEGVEFDGQSVCSINCTEIFKKAGWDAIGILGYDFISRFVVKIDYANKTLSFYDPETFQYTGNGKLLDTPLNGEIPVVPVTIDDKYPGRWQLDTGAGGSDFCYPFARQNDFLEREGVNGISFGAGGARRERTVQFETLEIAGYTVNKPLISFPTEEVTGTFGETEVTGNLGNNILRHFTIYLDYNRQQLIVEKGDDFDSVFPRTKSGMQIMVNDDKRFEVLFVSEDTPASLAGFKKGDIVLAINDIKVDNLGGLSAIVNLMAAEAGTEYIFTIIRNDQEKNLKLKLKELY